MDSPKITYKYYSNPAFCAQSEVVYTQQTPCVSSRITTSPPKRNLLPETRVPPLGANSPIKNKPQSEYDRFGNQRLKTDISDNPLRNGKGSSKNILDLPPKPGPKPSRYAIISPEARNIKKPFIRSASQRIISSKNEYSHRRVNSTRGHRIEEELEMFQVGNTSCPAEIDNIESETSLKARVLKHRYAEIPDDYDDFSPTKKRIVETEPEEYNVDAPSEDEMKEIPTEIVTTVNGKLHRYAIIPSEDEEEIIEESTTVIQHVQRAPSPPTFHLTSPNMSRKTLEATQKLHELLATPKKTPNRVFVGAPLKSCISTPSIRTQFQSPNRVISPERAGFPATPTKTIASSTPKQNVIASSKSCNNLTSPPLPRRNPKSSLSPRAQQKLIYDANTTIDTIHSSIKKPCPDFFVKDSSMNKSRENSFVKSKDLNRSYDMDRSRDSIKQKLDPRKTTAVISPRMKIRGDESIYSSASVFSAKNWNVSPGCATLALAATMMALCGALSAALSFYIMCTFGRHYYLDVGVLSGFICLMLGMLGFRSRTYQLLPNRNYVSGYIVLSIFSLMSCVALLTLLVSGSTEGGAISDLVGGAVTTLGALCLLMACGGALASCCCTKTPPDNRVMGA